MSEEKYRTLITEYKAIIEAKFDSTLEDVSLNHSKLDDALKNQITLELEWQAIHAKVKNLKERLEVEVEETYAASMKTVMSDAYKDVTFSEAKEYAKIDASHRSMRRLLLDAMELYDDTKGAVEVITSRRYVLNNITQSVVAGVNSHII